MVKHHSTFGTFNSVLLTLSGLLASYSYKTWGEPSFQSVAPRLWNALPLTLWQADSIGSFKKDWKTCLFKQAFG